MSKHPQRSSRVRRMDRVWVPFENVDTGSGWSGGSAVYPLEIQGLVAQAADLQAPFAFLTAGNTASATTVRASRNCTILAVSMSACGDGAAPAVGWIGIGVFPSMDGKLTSAPRVMAGEVPGIWPFCSPSRPAGGDDTGTPALYSFDTLQKGRRRVPAGYAIYASVNLTAGFDQVVLQPRILFGVE